MIIHGGVAQVAWIVDPCKRLASPRSDVEAAVNLQLQLLILILLSVCSIAVSAAWWTLATNTYLQ
ncbi:uncharacterized protein MYCFIDRAFT_177397 [Pseudocercospora fijiensis CIRAD86]|uniref:Uncharacterized protein n=1 Tax=Pseudocercospora fijiensis (strain CIRAD86) TaxID=383855 RepID=M3A755_PSEFD|nr:uncharacterized protein MYCFIDRAFT_177397 [Pseudocercospora fijiensis CIRAD86]EME80456.1 hypothetical protein MYCFIDRAFT_177397 [Pseudocercospora fijiensis CIRAD86]